MGLQPPRGYKFHQAHALFTTASRIIKPYDRNGAKPKGYTFATTPQAHSECFELEKASYFSASFTPPGAHGSCRHVTDQREPVTNLGHFVEIRGGFCVGGCRVVICPKTNRGRTGRDHLLAAQLGNPTLS